MRDDANSFVKRLTGFSLGPVLCAVIGFLRTPVATWFIVPEEFGKAAMFTLAFSISSIFIYLGIDQSFSREYNSQEDKKNLLWNSFLIPFCFSLLVAAAYFLFSRRLSMLLFNKEEQLIVAILALSMPLAVIFRFNDILIRMQEKAKLYSFVHVIREVIALVGLFLFLVFVEKSFRSVVFAYFIGLFVITLIVVLINKDFWFAKFKVDGNLLKVMVRFALPIVPASIFGLLLHSVDKIALRSWSDFDQLGLYSVAFKIGMVLSVIKASFANFWVPTAYRWYETGVDKKKFESVAKNLFVVLILVFSVIIFLKDHIVLLLGKEYAASAVIIPFLLMYPLMDTLARATNLGIVFSRKTWYKLLIFAVAFFLNLLGNYLLVPILGGLGASISTGLSFVFFFLLQSHISRRLWYKYDMRFFYVNIAIMVLLAILSLLKDLLFLKAIAILIMIFYNRKHIIYLCGVGRKFLAQKSY